MSSLELFLRLMKVGLDRRLVTGAATAETSDFIFLLARGDWTFRVVPYLGQRFLAWPSWGFQRLGGKRSHSWFGAFSFWRSGWSLFPACLMENGGALGCPAAGWLS
jgi:hypothetical protein